MRERTTQERIDMSLRSQILAKAPTLFEGLLPSTPLVMAAIALAITEVDFLRKLERLCKERDREVERIKGMMEGKK
jgi:hypothetical protein